MKRVRGHFERIGELYWVHCEGRTYTVPVAQDASPGSKATKAHASLQGGVLKSPMPGKVLKVNFNGGDVVESGQTVLVIEAMKMEYALKAPFKGKIKSVMKKTGDLVALDEKLAEIEKDGS